MYIAENATTLQKEDYEKLRPGTVVKVEAVSPRGSERLYVRVISISDTCGKIEGEVISLPILVDYHGFNFNQKVTFTKKAIISIEEEEFEATDVILAVTGDSFRFQGVRF